MFVLFQLKVQWNSTSQPTTQSYQSQGLLSPSYGGATYSFTADFRPPQEAPVLTTTATYKPVPMCFSSPRRRHSISLLEDDSQKPNVCRICGKSEWRGDLLVSQKNTNRSIGNIAFILEIIFLSCSLFRNKF